MFEELIKSEPKKRGLNEGHHVYIKAEKAEDVITAVDAFAKLTPAPVKAEKLEDIFALNPELKKAHELELQKAGDKRVQQALDKLKGKTETPAGGDDPNDDDVTKKIKAIIGPVFGELKTMIEGQQKAVAVANKRTQAVELLKAKKLSEKLVDLLNLDGEQTPEAEVARVEALFQEQLQDMNNQLVAAGIKPGTGKPGEVTVGEKAIEDVAKARSADPGSQGFATPKAFDKPQNQ